MISDNANKPDQLSGELAEEQLEFKKLSFAEELANFTKEKLKQIEIEKQTKIDFDLFVLAKSSIDLIKKTAKAGKWNADLNCKSPSDAEYLKKHLEKIDNNLRFPKEIIEVSFGHRPSVNTFVLNVSWEHLK